MVTRVFNVAISLLVFVLAFHVVASFSIRPKTEQRVLPNTVFLQPRSEGYRIQVAIPRAAVDSPPQAVPKSVHICLFDLPRQDANSRTAKIHVYPPRLDYEWALSGDWGSLEDATNQPDFNAAVLANLMAQGGVDITEEVRCEVEQLFAVVAQLAEGHGLFESLGHAQDFTVSRLTKTAMHPRSYVFWLAGVESILGFVCVACGVLVLFKRKTRKAS